MNTKLLLFFVLIFRSKIVESFNEAIRQREYQFSDWMMNQNVPNQQDPSFSQTQNEYAVNAAEIHENIQNSNEPNIGGLNVQFTHQPYRSQNNQVSGPLNSEVGTGFYLPLSNLHKTDANNGPLLDDVNSNVAQNRPINSASTIDTSNNRYQLSLENGNYDHNNIMSHPDIGHILSNNNKRYVIIYPNGTVDYADDIENIVKNNPKYTLIRNGIVEDHRNDSELTAVTPSNVKEPSEEPINGTISWMDSTSEIPAIKLQAVTNTTPSVPASTFVSTTSAQENVPQIPLNNSSNTLSLSVEPYHNTFYSWFDAWIRSLASVPITQTESNTTSWNNQAFSSTKPSAIELPIDSSHSLISNTTSSSQAQRIVTQSTELPLTTMSVPTAQVDLDIVANAAPVTTKPNVSQDIIFTQDIINCTDNNTTSNNANTGTSVILNTDVSLLYPSSGSMPSLSSAPMALPSITNNDTDDPSEDSLYDSKNLEIDISNVDGEPIMWVRTTDKEFFDKLVDKKSPDRLYYIKVAGENYVERNKHTTVYCNGTVVEELTETTYNRKDDSSPKIIKQSSITYVKDSQNSNKK